MGDLAFVFAHKIDVVNYCSLSQSLCLGLLCFRVCVYAAMLPSYHFVPKWRQAQATKQTSMLAAVAGNIAACTYAVLRAHIGAR